MTVKISNVLAQSQTLQRYYTYTLTKQIIIIIIFESSCFVFVWKMYAGKMTNIIITINFLGGLINIPKTM